MLIILKLLINKLVLTLLLSWPYCSLRAIGGTVQEGRGQLEKVEISAQDQSQLESLDHLALKVHWYTNLDSALYFAQQQQALALAIGDMKWAARALQNKGGLHYRKGNYETALTLFQQVIPIQEKLHNWSGLAVVYRRVGNSLRKMGRIPESLQAYQNGLLATEQQKEDNRSSKAAIFNSMGSLFLNQEDFEKAKEYYEKSLELHIAIGSEKGVAVNSNNLSKVYTVLEQYDLAQGLLLKSLAVKRAENDLEGIANSNKNLGDIFLKQEKLDSARFYYSTALQWQDSLGLRGDQASSFADLGVVSLAEEDWPAAADWCLAGWEQATEIGDLKVRVKNGGCLYRALRELGRPEDALSILEKTRHLKDSFLSAANTRELTELESAYQHQKAELEAEIYRKKRFDRTYLWWLFMVFIGIGLLYIFWRKRGGKLITPALEKDRPQLHVSTKEITPKASQEPKDEDALNEFDTAWLLQLDAVLKKEVDNPSFTVDQMAMALFISRSKLQRRVKKVTGLTPVQYFRELKLQVAMKLLASGKVETIRQVASAVGFDTPQYFSKLFEQKFGKKPSDLL